MNQTELVKTIEIKDKTGRVVGTKEVVTYPGLLSKAHEEGLRRIATKLVQVPSDENGRTAIARAFVETAKGRFAGIGDANPENVSTFIAPHLIRMAETRAKARALRDAVNIGIVSFEELDGDGFANGSPDLGSGAPPPQNARPPKNGNRAAKADAPPPAQPQQPRGYSRQAQQSTAPAGGGNGNGNGNGNGALMTEAQRRYLFRILAGQGMDNLAALDYLKEYFEVRDLSSVTKAAATTAIDDLLKGEGVPHGAA